MTFDQNIDQFFGLYFLTWFWPETQANNARCYRYPFVAVELMTCPASSGIDKTNCTGQFGFPVVTFPGAPPKFLELLVSKESNVWTPRCWVYVAGSNFWHTNIMSWLWPTAQTQSPDVFFMNSCSFEQQVVNGSCPPGPHPSCTMDFARSTVDLIQSCIDGPWILSG